jgi:hypothetical protein
MIFSQALGIVLAAAKGAVPAAEEYIESMRPYKFADEARRDAAESLRQLKEAIAMVERSM